MSDSLFSDSLFSGGVLLTALLWQHKQMKREHTMYFLGVLKQSYSQDVMIYRLNLKAEVHHTAITLHLLLMIRLLLDCHETTFTTDWSMKN